MRLTKTEQLILAKLDEYPRYQVSSDEKRKFAAADSLVEKGLVKTVVRECCRISGYNKRGTWKPGSYHIWTEHVIEKAL